MRECDDDADECKERKCEHEERAAKKVRHLNGARHERRVERTGHRDASRVDLSSGFLAR